MRAKSEREEFCIECYIVEGTGLLYPFCNSSHIFVNLIDVNLKVSFSNSSNPHILVFFFGCIKTAYKFHVLLYKYTILHPQLNDDPPAKISHCLTAPSSLPNPTRTLSCLCLAGAKKISN